MDRYDSLLAAGWRLIRRHRRDAAATPMDRYDSLLAAGWRLIRRQPYSLQFLWVIFSSAGSLFTPSLCRLPSSSFFSCGSHRPSRCRRAVDRPTTPTSAPRPTPIKTKGRNPRKTVEFRPAFDLLATFQTLCVWKSQKLRRRPRHATDFSPSAGSKRTRTRPQPRLTSSSLNLKAGVMRSPLFCRVQPQSPG